MYERLGCQKIGKILALPIYSTNRVAHNVGDSETPILWRSIDFFCSVFPSRPDGGGVNTT